MRKGTLAALCLFSAVLLLALGRAHAAADWQQEQAKLFEQIGLKPGDKIDSSNYEKLKGLLPDSVVEWVKKGDQPIVIAELKYEVAPDESWKQKSAKNEGQYGLDETLEVIDKTTGEYPLYVDGDPFPNIDWQNDPNAAIKLMHNTIVQRGRLGSYHGYATTNWVGRGGLEKRALTDYIDNYYWARPDGEVQNPERYIQQQLYNFVQPYDLVGLASLTRRYIGPKADEVYSYVPSIRRVKRLSGANRCDPYAGSDFVIDDSFGWQGKNTSMSWKFLEKKVGLMPIPDWMAKEPAKAIKQPNGSFAVGSEYVIKPGYEAMNWKGAPWSMANMVMVPRTVYVLEAKALDPYYAYGTTIYWVDDWAGIFYKVIYNRAGEYWKTMIVMPLISAWMDGGKPIRQTIVGSAAGYYVVDDKTDHASVSTELGKLGDIVISPRFLDPSIRPGIFSPSQLSTYSR